MRVYVQRMSNVGGRHVCQGCSPREGRQTNVHSHDVVTTLMRLIGLQKERKWEPGKDRV